MIFLKPVRADTKIPVAGFYQTAKNHVTANPIRYPLITGMCSNHRDDEESLEAGAAQNASVADTDSQGPARKIPKPVRRKPKFGRMLAFILIPLGTCWLLIEMLLVVAGISYPILYEPDDHCGVRLRAGLNVRYIEEGHSIVRTNSAGFRDREHFNGKEPDVYRIAVIGDSFCEAIQVNREQTFWSRLETDLNAAGHRVEILNFGISGYGTAQEYEMLRHTVLDYEPDLVLLLMFLGNDIGDNSRSINPGQIKPYYRIEDDRLVLDTSFRSDPRFLAAKSFSTRIKASLINSSRILQLLNHGYSRWKRRAGPKPNVGIGLDPAVYRKPESRDWEDAWQVTEKLLEAFVKQCQHQGAESLIVTGSIPIQVHPLASVRDQFQREHPIDSLFYPNDRIRRFCADREIRLFQLARRFRQDVDASPAPIYYHGFSNTVMGTGHWNERGHQRAAELLSEYLQATLLKSKPHEGHGKIRQ